MYSSTPFMAMWMPYASMRHPGACSLPWRKRSWTFSMKRCGKHAARLESPMSKTRILITTTSFQDTPGRHHALLAGDAYDIERARGPLPESAILTLVGDYDAILCGDDAFTRPG